MSETTKSSPNPGGPEIYFALGRDGHAVGNHRHRGAGACVAVSVAEAGAGGRNCQHPRGGALQRQH